VLPLLYRTHLGTPAPRERFKASDVLRFAPSAILTAMPSPWPSEPPVISMPGVYDAMPDIGIHLSPMP
jgi:hypothetical protein